MTVMSLCHLVLLVSLHGQNSSEVQIRKLAADAAAAYKVKDLAKYLGFFTPDYSHRKLSGEALSRPEFDAQVAFQLTELSVKGMSSSLWRLNIEDKWAYSIVHSRITAVAGGEEAEVKRLARLTWRQTPTGWKIAVSEVIAEKITVTSRTLRPEFWFRYDNRPFMPAIAIPNNDAHIDWLSGWWRYIPR